jgi:F-type H+-transporting ATPase subunit epsilon
MALQVELVSPERIVYEGEAVLVIARTTDGEIGFQAGHVPFVGNLVSSVVRIALEPEGIQHIAVHSGFIEVSNDHVTLLSDVAELAQDIDVARATAAKDRAEAAIRTDADNADAIGALGRAEARLLAAQSAK